MMISNWLVALSILITHSISVTAFVNPSTFPCSGRSSFVTSTSSSVATPHENKCAKVSSRRGNRGTALHMSTSTGKDFYKILGVTRNADAKEIKSAYRRKAKQYHPGELSNS
jgi:DnaJ domain